MPTRYSKQTWVNGSGGGTPINATRLSYLEDGIENATVSDRIDVTHSTYGADPTGAVDATTAFAAAITAAASAGLSVFVPPGTYNFNGITSTALTLPSGTNLIGVKGRSKLHFTSNAAGTAAIRTAAGANNVTLRDLVIYSNNVAIAGNTVVGSGFVMDLTSACADILVEGCEFYYFYTTCVTTTGTTTSTRITIRNNTFHDISTVIHANAGISAAVQTGTTNGAVIADNQFYNCGQRNSDWAIYIASLTSNTVVRGNTITSCSSGIQFYGYPSDHINVLNNVMKNLTAGNGVAIGIASGTGLSYVNVCNNVIQVTSTRAAITIDNCSQALVANNIIDCGSAAADGVDIRYSSTDVVVSGNNIYNTTGVGVLLTGADGAHTRLDIINNTIVCTGNTAIHVLPSGSTTITSLTISRNRTKSTVTYGVLIQWAVTNLIVNDNQVDSGSYSVRVLIAATNFQVCRNVGIGSAANIKYQGTNGRVADNVATVNLETSGTNVNITTANNFVTWGS